MAEGNTSKQMRRIVGLALAWLVVSLLMFLAPSPREWGEFGHRISPFYDEIKSVFQPAVHVVLMASMAVLCMHIFRRQDALASTIFSFGVVLVLAALFEGLQSLLPSGFSRRADLADMVPSAAGAIIGCTIGLGARVFKTREDRNRPYKN